MDTRKDYVAPAIAAEDNLEQTSLACNATTDQLNGTFGPGCTTRVDKGGAWYIEDFRCDIGVDEPVVLS